jgi:glutamine amidotransferase-like uncharacterized protein
MHGRIGLFLRHPECSRQCCAGMMRALSPHYSFKIFTEKDVTAGMLQEVDIVAMPGGIGEADKYYEFFKRRTANAIADYVSSGGRYLGICMGAYWADYDYFDLLDGVRCRQYIKRPWSDIKRSYATTARVRWLDRDYRMYFHDGTAFVGDASKFVTVARYANNDPMAIIQNRVGLIGCHPESMYTWYDRPYLRAYWHKESHHKLLLDFVDALMNSGRTVKQELTTWETQAIIASST